MSKIPISEIDQYNSFFKLFDNAFNEARKNISSNLKKPISIETLSHMVSNNAYRSYVRSRSGYTRLDETVFSSLIRFLKKNNVDRLLVGELKLIYEVYKKIEYNFSAKKNKFRGANFISTANIDEKFYQLISSNGYNIQQLIKNEDNEFYKFIDKVTEGLFSENLVGDCITNAYVITEYIQRNRYSTFNSLEDRTYLIRLSFVARIGAWAAQSVGQRFLFKKFEGTVKKALDVSVPQTAIGLSTVQYHASKWNNALGNTGAPSLEEIAKAYEAAQLLDKSDPFNEVSVILLNGAKEAILGGAKSHDKVASFGNFTISELISQADNIDAFGAYGLGSSMHRIQIKAFSYISDGKFEEAQNEIAKCWKIYVNSGKDNAYFLMKLSACEGMLHQKMLKILETPSLRFAYDLAIQLGAFQYAVEYAEAMGWK